MRTRLPVAAAIAAGFIGVLGGCGDAFGPEDAVGTWELERMNDDNVPGTVTIKWDGGAQSDQVVIQSATLAFAAGGTCVWAVQLDGEDPFSTNDCTYDVAADTEIVTVLIGSIGLSGPASGRTMTLTDEDSNVLVFRQR